MSKRKLFYLRLSVLLLSIIVAISVQFVIAFIIVFIVGFISSFYFLKNENEEKITLSHIYRKRIFQEDSFYSIQLENKLNEKSIQLYQAYIVFGTIISLVSCFILTAMINLTLVDAIKEIFIVSSLSEFLKTIVACSALLMLIYLFYGVLIFFGNVSVISGIYMIPLIKEYKKYQFSLELLSDEGDIVSKEKIEKRRDDWFGKNKKTINRYFNNSTYLDIFTNYFK